MIPRRIGVVGFDGLNGLDLVGPMESFATASVDARDGTRRAGYEVTVMGLSNRPFVTEAGLKIVPNGPLTTARGLDTLIIPGGRGLRERSTCAALTRWLLAHAGSIRRIASVCTGIYGLAPTGLLDGRRVTTHWRFTRDVAERFPRLRLEPDALYLKDGPFYTSAGITAGIDLSLALIEEDYGSPAALAVARELVVFLKRPGGQSQYSEPLKFQSKTTDRLADIAAWAASHLDENLSVENLAKQSALSERHFRRLFMQAYRTTPARLVEDLRLDEARRRLLGSRHTMDTIATSVGFGSADVFRRVFQRRFGIPPHVYRQRFGTRTRLRRASEKGARSR